ncbi:hypothetical protein Sjap_011412 [Stephania japonica]|uniref:Uncharacterized protein n=1 Tax=Stephania japonica TaxID=461633 RepID=A0AAP0JCC6_9MAGN
MGDLVPPLATAPQEALKHGKVDQTRSLQPLASDVSHWPATSQYGGAGTSATIGRGCETTPTSRSSGSRHVMGVLSAAPSPFLLVTKVVGLPSGALAAVPGDSDRELPPPPSSVPPRLRHSFEVLSPPFFIKKHKER